MLTIKNKNRLKNISVILACALITLVFARPAAARRESAAKGDSAQQQNQNSQPAATAPSQPANSGRAVPQQPKVSFQGGPARERAGRRNDAMDSSRPKNNVPIIVESGRGRLARPEVVVNPGSERRARENRTADSFFSRGNRERTPSISTQPVLPKPDTEKSIMPQPQRSENIPVYNSRHTDNFAVKEPVNNSIPSVEAEVSDRNVFSRPDSRWEHKDADVKVVDSIWKNSMATRSARQHRQTDGGAMVFSDNAGRFAARGTFDNWAGHRDSHSNLQYVHRNEYVYSDHHNIVCHRIIWPDYHFTLYYNFGHRRAFTCFYPYYHRRYVFVSLGGFWPTGCNYLRYYWYGWYPYGWYGYSPIPYEVQGDTYNYYTYNYYNNNGTPDSTYNSGAITPVDENTFKDVREKLARQAEQKPASQTDADTLFDEGVKAFGEADYETALEKFASAREISPEDTVLPFAYAQTLFAEGRYDEAAGTLRVILANAKPEKEGVFYPRGLYSSDDILIDQINVLKEQAAKNSTNPDLQLLLGYHLIGVGELDEAVEPLQKASLDTVNNQSATALLGLTEKIKADETSEK